MSGFPRSQNSGQPGTPEPVTQCPSPPNLSSCTVASLKKKKSRGGEGLIKFYLQKISNSRKAKSISFLSKWFPDREHIN